MTGESSPESGAGNNLMELFKDLGREEILDVLAGGDGFCQHCQGLLQSRIQSITNKNNLSLATPNSKSVTSTPLHSANSSNGTSKAPTNTTTSWNSAHTPKSTFSGPRKVSDNSSPASVNSSRPPVDLTLNDGLSGSSAAHDGVPEEQKERIRVSQVLRKKDFVHMERVDGRQKNVLQGLELHQRVFNADEQKEIVKSVYNLQRMGQRGELRERTYSEPKKWMRGKGRVTIQFGCCYNYAVDKNGNPPGILREEEVDPLPPMFKKMIRRMVRWHVLPPTCVPNSCIVNIYDEGDCIPPHIDHHDFLRPFCTVSFLTECNILFGGNLRIAGPGEFVGPVSIPLPVGSVLILNGNGADVAKHCVPGVPGKRISITFRRMDESKIPYSYTPDPELVGLKPLSNSPLGKSVVQESQKEETKKPTYPQPAGLSNIVAKTSNIALFSEKDDFPPLGASNFPPLGSASSGSKQQWGRRSVLRQ